MLQVPRSDLLASLREGRGWLRRDISVGRLIIPGKHTKKALSASQITLSVPLT